jgi:two-component system cell cycle sensor histidine kinase/response regulator CckA
MTNEPDTHDWLQTLFDESPLAIGFSRDGVMLDANPAYLRLFGHESAAELRGKSLLEQIAPSHRARVLDTVKRRALGDPLPQLYRTRGLRKDGSEFPMEVTTRRVVVADRPLTLAFFTDVSESERALEALTASEERFRTLSQGASEGVFVHADGKIVLANQVGCAMYRYDTAASMVGLDVMDLISPESRALVAEQIRRASSEPYEVVLLRKDGSSFVGEVRATSLVHQGVPVRVSVIRDITERKRTESEQHALAERVRQAQKLESLGVLAGGVAHDFNNILTVIANGVALARRDAELGATSVAHLDAVARAAQHAADLCHQLLAYTGTTRLERQTVDLSALVGEMSSVLEAAISKRASLVLELPPALPALFADATQIRQIVLNLVLNASEAIAGPNGVIRVSTGAAVGGGAPPIGALALGTPLTGSNVWLEVRDDGTGMDAATAAQIFDPFFTTKFVGRGLGMAAVAGIVRSHEGAVEVETSPGRGTRIRVFLPASVDLPAAPPSPRVAEPRTDGVVLVVDDEKNVRTSLELLLRGLGFEVLTACDGAEAVAVFTAEHGRIDVVLLDLTMPRMSGMEVLEVFRRIAPKVPVILTSGYGSARLEGERAGGLAPDAVLSKPYSVEHLLATLALVRT